MSKSRRRLAGFLIAASIAGTYVPTTASAQAWVPRRGEGSVAISIQTFNFSGHYASTGETLRLGGAQSQGVLLEVDYGLTDRLSLSAGLPYIMARNGHDPSPVLGHTGIDDGHYHGAWQNYRIGGRFNVLTDPVVVTPYFELAIPSHSYPTEGEAAIGRGLQEVTVGVSAARRLDPWLPRAFVHARASRAFVEALHGIDTDRDNVDLDLGWFFTDRWSTRLSGNWQQTNGGINFPGDVLEDPELFHAHDRILDDDHLRLGTGVTFALTRVVDVDLAYVRTVRGSNTHVGYGVSLGVSFAFGAPRSDSH